MSFSVRFGSLTIDGCTEWTQNNRRRIIEHRFPRRPGAIGPQAAAKDAKEITLNCEVFKDSDTEIRDYFNNIETFLDQRLDKLYLRDDNRFLWAIGELVPISYRANSDPAKHAFYNLRFVAHDPYWYDGVTQTDTQNLGAGNVLTWPITNNGGVRTPPAIEINRTGAGQQKFDVIITNTTTGLYLRWNGSLGAGSKLIFDVVNKRVTIGGGNGLTDFQGTLNFELEPGVNNLRYDGPGEVTIDTAWLQRWA